MDAVKTLAEQRVVLPASWGTFERLMAEKGERRSPRFYYDRGVLEIVSPSTEHDAISRVLALLIPLLAHDLDLDVFNAGSTTFRREDLSRGFEPDESFYFSGNAARAREAVGRKGNLDLDAGDPAPDLVVEVDITSPSLERLPIYARLGVPEVWRHDGERLEILGLDKTVEGYSEIPESAFLARVTGEVVTRFVAEGLALDSRAWMRNVADWRTGGSV